MSIAVEDFDIAIARFYDTWQKLEEQSDWRHAQILTSYGVKYLRVTKHLSTGQVQVTRPGGNASDQEIAISEDDEEALAPQLPSTSIHPKAIYDIVHSTSYQVPVLYMSFKDFPGGARPPLDAVHSMLVPAAHKSEIESVGVMGALSMAEHPVTGVPAYFVHPCRTQEAMAPLLQGQMISPEHYILLWLGLVGGSVGLNVPVELAQAVIGSLNSKHDGRLESSQTVLGTFRSE